MGRPAVDGVAYNASAAKRGDRLMTCLVIAVYTISALVPLSALDRVGVILCPFRAVLGLPCPSCGMTHAFVALGHGDLAAAWHYNALSAPLFAFGLLWLMGRLTGARTLPALSRQMEAVLLIAALAVTLAYGAYRIFVPSARPF